MTDLLPRMSGRDRTLLVGTCIAAVVVSIVLLVDVPLYQRSRQMEERSAEERKRLTSIVSMSQEYLSLRAELDDIRRTAFNGGGASLSGIDTIVGKSGLKRKLASVKATTKPIADGIKAIKAEMSLEKVSLADLSALIAALEADGHAMAIERISLKATYEDPSVFNATLILNTVERESS